jgi:hypothetical protein
MSVLISISSVHNVWVSSILMLFWRKKIYIRFVDSWQLLHSYHMLNIPQIKHTNCLAYQKLFL